MFPSVEIRLETDLVVDAAQELLRVHKALIRRHGDAFRALDRRIEALMESGDLPSLHQLADDSAAITLLATPPQEWLDVLAEAKRLGVS